MRACNGPSMVTAASRAAVVGTGLRYVGVYTLWLKPRTWLNIVIGGAAGSRAVLSGSAAAGNWAHPSAVGSSSQL